MNRKPIEVNLILTRQEHHFIGGTSVFGNLQEDVPVNPYIPEGIILERLTPEQADEERKRRGFIKAEIIGMAAGILKVVMGFAPLDPETHETEHDPQFGIWDEEQHILELVVNGVDVNRKVHKRMREDKSADYYLRESRFQKEDEGRSSKEKK